MPRVVGILLVLIVAAISVTYFLFSSMGNGQGMMGKMPQMHDWLNGKSLPYDLNTPRPPENEASIKAGQDIYKARCIFCHGSKGDGKGKKADKLKTRPANFASGTFKFRSTLNPAPTNLDIFKTISRGLHGTAMLPWLELTTTEKWQVAYYIKTFTDLFGDEESKALIIPPPTMSKSQYISLGRDVYRKARCYECHGLEGLGNGEKAGNLKDIWYRPIRPRNFREQLLKRGVDIEEIYMTVATGLGGTPMISFFTLLKEDEILAVSYYVQSIARKPSEEGMKGMKEMMGNMTPDEQIGMRVYHHGS